MDWMDLKGHRSRLGSQPRNHNSHNFFWSFCIDVHASDTTESPNHHPCETDECLETQTDAHNRFDVCTNIEHPDVSSNHRNVHSPVF